MTETDRIAQTILDTEITGLEPYDGSVSTSVTEIATKVVRHQHACVVRMAKLWLLKDRLYRAIVNAYNVVEDDVDMDELGKLSEELVKLEQKESG